MEKEKFKIKLEPYFNTTFLGYCLSGLVFIVYSKFDWGLIKVYYWTFPIGMALCFGLAVLFRGINATIVSGQQISGIAVHGFRKKMELSEIERVLPISLGVISFIRVIGRNHKTSIWIPTVHENQNVFENLIISRTNSGNPLREYYEFSRLKVG